MSWITKCSKDYCVTWRYRSKCLSMCRLIRTSWILVVVLYSRQTFSIGFDNSTSIYVERCYADCRLQKDFGSCGKYRAVKWLHDVVREKEFSYGPFRVVRIPSLSRQPVLPKLPQSRAFKRNIIETMNFVRDAVEDLLTKRAVVYTIDSPANARTFDTGLMVVDEDEFQQMQKTQDTPSADWRIFKKKKSLILPILILLNLIKLKLLILPIFLGVHFIKKLLVLGSLALPSLLAHLKICKVPPHPPTYPHPLWATAADAPVDYPSGYDQEEAGWLHRHDVQGHVVYPGYHGYRNPYG